MVLMMKFPRSYFSQLGCAEQNKGQNSARPQAHRHLKKLLFQVAAMHPTHIRVPHWGLPARQKQNTESEYHRDSRAKKIETNSKVQKSAMGLQ